MTGRVRRFCVLITVVAVTLGLAACTPGRQQQGGPEQASSSTRVQPSKAPEPRPVDRVVEFGGFVTPSGNVSCMVAADLARCDIIDRDWSPPPRPADCEFDYGQGIAIAPGDPAYFVCAGDTTFGVDEVLQYGDSVTAGSMRCESAESGVTCRDVESGHGFVMSRQAYRLF